MYFYRGRKNTKEVIISHKEIRMVEVGKDSHGLQTMNLKNLG